MRFEADVPPPGMRVRFPSEEREKCEIRSDMGEAYLTNWPLTECVHRILTKPRASLAVGSLVNKWQLTSATNMQQWLTQCSGRVAKAYERCS